MTRSPFDKRNARRKQCADEYKRDAHRIRVRQRKSIFQTVIAPADGTITAAVGNGDFGTSPFCRQLSTSRDSPPCIYMACRSVKHNEGVSIYIWVRVAHWKGGDFFDILLIAV